MKNNFYYSQSSIRVYEKCPKLFEYMYINKLYGKTPTKDVLEKIKNGTDFHILAERYFNGMDDYFYVEDPQLLKWMAILEDEYPKTKFYKSEIEIKENIEKIKIMAKYDLLINQGENIKIIDFKTNEKEYSIEVMEKDIQTKLYMYLVGEHIEKINNSAKLENITMEYFQLNYPKNKIVIKYNEKKHKKNQKEIKKIIQKIEFNQKKIYSQNLRNCDFCGFRSFCNNKN